MLEILRYCPYIIWKQRGITMQTFMPSYSFSSSAVILDNRRLNKQIVEAYQIWSGRVPNANHPAYLMWKGYNDALLLYIATLLNEYSWRNNKRHAVYDNVKDAISTCTKRPITYPKWVGNELFHTAHSVNLIRKNKTHYTNRDFFYKGMVIPKYDVSEYPTGYYWPIMPVGKKAREDRAAWEKWGKEHGMDLL